jgi:hypothetical protein
MNPPIVDGESAERFTHVMIDPSMCIGFSLYVGFFAEHVEGW